MYALGGWPNPEGPSVRFPNESHRTRLALARGDPEEKYLICLELEQKATFRNGERHCPLKTSRANAYNLIFANSRLQTRSFMLSTLS